MSSDLPALPDPQEGRKLLAAATEGPWFAEAALTDDDDPAQIVGVAWPNPDGWAPVVCTPGSASFATEATNREADAALIVWLRNNAPALLDAVEAVGRVEAMCDEWERLPRSTLGLAAPVVRRALDGLSVTVPTNPNKEQTMASETRPITRNAMVIRAALLELPETCRYHGDEIEGRDRWRYAGACCATGQPSLMRRRALASLDDLDAIARRSR